jgi:hypothetical protein
MTRAEKQRAITIVTSVIDKPLRPLQKVRPGQLLVVLPTLRHILLFGKPLRAFSTKDNCESVIWPRVMNLGIVIMKKIGQSACLLPNDDMIVNGRASETERIWVDEEGLINRSRLKIQSIPLWKHRGTRVHIPIKIYANATQVNNKTRNIILNNTIDKNIKIINNDKIINN